MKNDLVKALEFDKAGNWHTAHEIAQSQEDTKNYDLLHAYLHRKEGDNWNANYWYRRCGETMPQHSLDEEWQILMKRFAE